MRAGLHPRTIRSIEQAIGKLATQSVARMDERLPWFRSLPADQRSWVTLVAQAGMRSYVEWLRQPDDVLRLTGEVFAAAPRTMARSVTLQQTVELVRQTIAVAEENLPLLAGEDDKEVVAEELLRFSREIAFAAARVYAIAAERRGSWDARLEALVIDRLVSGLASADAGGDTLPSQLAALGWRTPGPIGVIAGSAPADPKQDVRAELQMMVRRLGIDAMSGVHADRLVVVFGGTADPAVVAATVLPLFGDGPVVVGPSATDPADAVAVTRATLSGLRAARGWPGAPRPVPADDLLPERALLGDTEAGDQLVDTVYRPLVAAGDVIVETLATFLDLGGALEATARALFVHVNTVRYRLRRVADECGAAPTDARGAFVLRTALVVGRLGRSDNL